MVMINRMRSRYRNHHPSESVSVFPALCAVAASCFLFFGCTDSGNFAGKKLNVFFTCDTRGRLEPCGCFTGQFGGLTRLKTVLDSEPPADALLVDVGDAIGGHADYDLIQYRYMLRAFAAMKFDAMNLGHREAQLSATQLREIKKAAPVPILSANVLDEGTGKPLFDAYRIIQRAGSRIAVVGVVDPAGIAEEDIGDGVTVANMESTLVRLLTEIKPKADLIVLLAFTDEPTLARLAQQFYEIKIILGGKVSQPAQELKPENRSLIYFVTNEARALGVMRLQLKRNAMPNVLHNEIRLLHDKIPQDESFVALAQEYRDEVRRTPLEVDNPANAAGDMVPGVRTAATFVGTEQCISCHQSAAEVWKNSGHAHAFATLMARQADADPKCISCHTVGFGTASGYHRQFGKEKLVNVGCESCHGPGSLHVRQRQGEIAINFTYRELGPGDCQKCHYGEFSRPFDWDKFWPAIQHGKEQWQTTATAAFANK